MANPRNDRQQPAGGSGSLSPGEPTASIPEHAPASFPSSPSAAAPSPVFAPGEVVAGRFTIVRFIAKGGMGEVYEAEDRELQERVALKTIRPDIAGDPRAIERFKREIHLSRKVTHPNVCRIFDLFHHRAAGGPDRPDGEVKFLSMEHLAGETLGTRLRERGRMSSAEALPIVTQMASALAAAHEAGVIHRDFKSQNVILVPGDAGPRAVVTDFGLARAGGAGSDSTLTTTGHIAGTPTYMAPEQLEGGEITAATDVYSLGIVMYEMMTGAPPFVGDSPLSTAMKRLKEAPPPPRSRCQDLDPRWETVILRCLERDPADRFARAADVVRALSGEEVTRGRRTRKQRRRRAALATLALGFLVALVVAQHLGLGRRLRETASRGPAPAQSRPSVAVLGFRNLSGRADTAWMSTAFAEMLRTELAAGERLRTVPSETVARMMADLSLGGAESLARDTLARVGSHIGADFVVLGSYLALGEKGADQVRLDLRLQDTRSGETLIAVPATGSEATLFELVSAAGRRLRAQLGVSDLSARDAGATRTALPATPEAARLYAEGLDLLRVHDAVAARQRLEEAVRADPNHALAHSALSSALADLGYDAQAQAEAKRAFDLSGDLPREDRLLIEGRYREAIRERDEAVRVYRSLWGLFPDNLDHGLRLVEALSGAGKEPEALEVLESLRRLPASDDDPRLDLAQARVAAALSDFEQAQSLAARAAERANRAGARHLVAGARMEEGLALRHLGELPRAKKAFEVAETIADEAGDRFGIAHALNSTAMALSDEGDLAGAKARFEQSLAIFRQLGARKGVASCFNNLAWVLAAQGDYAKARSLYEEALAVYREVDDKIGISTALGNIGLMLKAQGDATQAMKRYEEAMEISRAIGDRVGVAWQLNSMGILLAERGELERARDRFEKCLALRREIGQKQGIAQALINLAAADLDRGNLESSGRLIDEGLAVAREVGGKHRVALALKLVGDVLAARGDLAGAHENYDAALAICTEIGLHPLVAICRTALARLSIEEGRPAEAVLPLRESLLAFDREKSPDEQATAHALLARALLGEGRKAEARQALEKAHAAAARTENPTVHLAVQLVRARLDAASGQSARALQSLKAIVADASRYGYLALELEARLVRGEVEMAAGQVDAARARLQALEQEATTKGFGQIASRAAAARIAAKGQG
jgi:tetratricopeptide (TPR) repeat protein/TolB-like protein